MYTGGRHPKRDVNRAVKPQNSKILERFFFSFFFRLVTWRFLWGSSVI